MPRHSAAIAERLRIQYCGENLGGGNRTARLIDQPGGDAHGLPQLDLKRAWVVAVQAIGPTNLPVGILCPDIADPPQPLIFSTENRVLIGEISKAEFAPFVGCGRGDSCNSLEMPGGKCDSDASGRAAIGRFDSPKHEQLRFRRRVRFFDSCRGRRILVGRAGWLGSSRTASSPSESRADTARRPIRAHARRAASATRDDCHPRWR